MKQRSVISEVEADYGQPFWDVVKAYADDGESINATALILGYAHPGAFHRLVKRHGKQHWFKPGTETNSFKSAIAHKPMTENRKAQLSDIHNRHLFLFQGILATRAGHARRLGISPNTVSTRVAKGMSVFEALTSPVKSRKYNPGNNKNSHPWRATYETSNRNIA